MAKIEESRRNDRSERIKKSKDESNLIADNGLDGKVKDIYDILNGFSDPIITKLKKLGEYGISDEMIVEAYSNMTRNVESEENVIDTLKIVFRNLALYVTQQPNGIVLDLDTGEIDKKASYRQALRVGITNEDYFERFVKTGKEAMHEDFYKLRENAAKEENYIIKSSMEIGKLFDRSDFKEYLEKNPEFLKLSSKSKELLKQAREYISKEDPTLMELYKIEIEIDNSRGTPNHEALLKERERFLKSHPKYKTVARDIRDEKQNIRPDIVSRYSDYNRNIKINCLLSQIAKVKDIDIKSLTPEERKATITAALAGLNIAQTLEDKNTMNKECWSILKLIAPEITDENNVLKKEKLYSFLEREFDLKDNLTPEKFQNLLQISGEAMDRSLNYERYKNFHKARNFILGGAKKIADKIFNKYFSDPSNIYEINFQEELEKKDKTQLEIYFNDSKIKFTKKDEKEFNEIYQNCTVESWIDNKDKALALKYASLVRAKENLNKMPSTDYYNRKREEIENAISEFKTEHPDKKYEKEDGTLLDEINDQAENYQNKMVESAVLKFYSLDAFEYNNEEKGYAELDDKHKKAYLRNVLVGLKYGEQSDNKSILKLAQRRLELLNTPDKTFIAFENGEPIINEKQILEEYNSMSKSGYSTYDELVNSAEERKISYLLKKLDDYSKLREEDFIKLKNPNDLALSLEQIEKIKEDWNRREDIQAQIETKTIEQKEEKVLEDKNISQLEENSEIYKNEKTNWLQRGIDTFKNLFKPRLTDGTTENNKRGIFSRIFNRTKLNNNLNKKEIVLNTNQEKIPNKTNDWIVQGVSGELSIKNEDNNQNQVEDCKSQVKESDELEY